MWSFSEMRWTISLRICRSFNHDATNNHTNFQKKSCVHFTRNPHSKIQIIEKNGNFLRSFIIHAGNQCISDQRILNAAVLRDALEDFAKNLQELQS